MAPAYRPTYRIGADLGIWRVADFPVLRPRDINHAVDDGMTDVDPLGSELLGQRLRQRSQRKLAGREGGNVGAGLDGRRCAGED